MNKPLQFSNMGAFRLHYSTLVYEGSRIGALHLLEKGLHGLIGVTNTEKVAFCIEQAEQIIQEPERIGYQEVALQLQTLLNMALKPILSGGHSSSVKPDGIYFQLKWHVLKILAVREVHHRTVMRSKELRENVGRFLGPCFPWDHSPRPDEWYEAVFHTQNWELMSNAKKLRSR